MKLQYFRQFEELCISTIFIDTPFPEQKSRAGNFDINYPSVGNSLLVTVTVLTACGSTSTSSNNLISSASKENHLLIEKGTLQLLL